MDPFTLTIIVGGLLLLSGGGKKKRNGRACVARMDRNGNMVDFVWDEAMKACIPTSPFIPPDDAEEEDPVIRDNGEPDYKPGPIDKKQLVVPPVDEEEEEEQEEEEEEQEDTTWIPNLEALIADTPKANRFYQLYKNGPLAADVARTVLSAAGINTGSNRVALIKCMTLIPWNQDHYSSTRTAQSWGTMFNVDGLNLSAAWMPRHDPAMQLLAMKQRVPRNINEAGGWLGGESKYGLIWIPRINDIQGKVICDPLAEGPPAWLLNALQG